MAKQDEVPSGDSSHAGPPRCCREHDGVTPSLSPSPLTQPPLCGARLPRPLESGVSWLGDTVALPATSLTLPSSRRGSGGAQTSPLSTAPSQGQQRLGGGTYCSSPRPSCPRSRCRSRTASGPAHSGCSCSGTGTAHRCARLGQGTGTGVSTAPHQGRDGTGTGVSNAPNQGRDRTGTRVSTAPNEGMDGMGQGSALP